MAGIWSFALGVVGAVIGYVVTFGNPAGAAWGWAIGSAIGAIGEAIFAGSDGTVQKGPRLGDLTVQTSTYGAPIPKIYGTARIAGNVFWSKKINEKRKVRHLDGDAEFWEYSYYGNFAVGLAEGPIAGVRKVWLDGKLYTKFSGDDIGPSEIISTQRKNHITIYKGTDDQTVDANMGGACAYRDLAYILFDDLKLENYGNRLPTVTCEVVADGYISTGNFLVDDCNLTGAAAYDETYESLKKSGASDAAYTGSTIVLNNIQSSSRTYGITNFVKTPQDTGGIYIFEFEWSRPAYCYTDNINADQNGSVRQFLLTPNPYEGPVLDGYYQTPQWGNAVNQHMLSFFLRYNAADPMNNGVGSETFTVVERVAGVNNQLFDEAYTYSGYDAIRIVVNWDHLWFEVYDNTGGTPTLIGARTNFSSALKTGIGSDFQIGWHYHNYGDFRTCNIDNINLQHGDATGLEVAAPTVNNTHIAMTISGSGHLITADTTTNLITVHNGISGDILTQFACPNPRYTGTATPYGLATYGADLFVAFTETHGGTKYSYVSHHVGLTGATNLISAMDGFTNDDVGDIAFYAGQLYAANRTNNTIIKYIGKNPEPWDTGTPIVWTKGGLGGANSGNNIFGLTFDGSGNLYEGNMGDETIYKRTGTGAQDTSLALVRWEANSVGGIYWHIDSGILWVSRVTTHSILGLDGLTSGIKQAVKVVATDFILEDVFNHVCEQVGLDSTLRDTSALSELTGLGYVRADRMPARRVLEPLMGAYLIDAAEYDHKINFIQRGGANQVTITEDEIAAVEYGGEIPNKMEINRVNETEIPREFVINFIAIVNDYQQGASRSVRMSTDSENVTVVEYPIVMSYTQAKQLAEILHNTMYTERTTYVFTTYMKYIYLAPSDVITVDGFKMRITSMSIKQNLLQITATAENDANYTSSAVADNPTIDDPQIIETTPPTAYVMLDIPILQDSDNNVGFYIACNGYGSSAWTGGIIYSSADGGANYNEALSLFNESIIGRSQDTLAEQTYYPGTFDEINTVNVMLGSTNWTLSNATALQVMSDQNLCALGAHGRWELMGFKTATVQGDGSYILSGLLRGRYGTEWAMDSHEDGDTFVMLDLDNLGRYQHSAGNISVAQSYKILSSEYLQTLYNGFEFTSESVGLKPYAPSDVTATRDGTDIDIVWKRRARIDGEWDDSHGVPFDEEVEQYSVDILSGAGGTVVRTLTTVVTPAATYTTADQNTDGHTPGDPVYVKVYQISATVGRGYANEVLV